MHTRIRALDDEHAVSDVSNRLGVFCHCFRGTTGLSSSTGSPCKQLSVAGTVSHQAVRALHNIAETCLIAVRQERATAERAEGSGAVDEGRLSEAESAIERMLEVASPELQRQIGLQRLRAELA